MSSLRDLAVDLINDAKSTRDGQEKLYILEQIKEIIFHRDATLLAEIMPEVVNFMIEKSIPVRRFLIKFAGEALKMNIAAAIVPFVSLISYMTSSEAPDNLLQQCAHEIQSHFDNIIIYIADMSIKSKSSTQSDPTVLWSQFRKSISYLMSLVSSDRSDNLRIACLKLSQCVILFGLPPPPPINDPRLLRAMKGEMSATKSRNAEDVPLHHPFINRNELVQESEDLYSKMLLWSSKNGPQDYPFGTVLVSLLGELIASVAVSRPKKGVDAANAIIMMIQGKSSLCSSMTAAERERLARAGHRLVRISVAFVDTDGSIPKLRAALAGLESLGVTPATSENRKRDAGQMEEGSDDEDQEQKKLRLSAVEAVNAFENQRKKQVASSSSISMAANASNIAASTVASSSLATETELASDLTSSIKEPSAFVTQVINIAGMNTLAAVPINSDDYRDIAHQSFQRTLNCYHDIQLMGTKAKINHLQLTIRSALMLAYNMDVSEDNSLSSKIFPDVTIQVISAIPTTAAKTWSKLPLSVNIPRAIWQLIAFVLSPPTKQQMAIKSIKDDPSLFIAGKMLYIQALCHTLLSRSIDESSGTHDSNALALHESICFVVVSRLLQNPSLQYLAKEFLQKISMIPKIVYILLQCLMHTGTKPSQSMVVGTSRREKEAMKNRNRGTKAEAMQLLSHLSIDYSQKKHQQALLKGLIDEEISRNYALNNLLWCSVSDDFELRSKAVSLIISELLPHEEMNEAITIFALQSAITIVGTEATKALRSRMQLRYQSTNEKPSSETEIQNNAERNEDNFPSNTDVMDEEQTFDADQDNTVDQCSSLLQAAYLYDGGRYYDGNFDMDPPMNSDLVTDIAAYEQCIRRKLHLLLQLCVYDYKLLLALMDLYVIAISSSSESSDQSSSISKDEPKEQESKNQSKIETKVSIFVRILQMEMNDIIPGIAKIHRPDIVFKSLMPIDPIALPLLESTLTLLMSDMHVPASSSLVEYVEMFVMKVIPEDEVKRIQFLIPVLAGFPAEDIENRLLPKLVASFADKPEILRTAYQRIVLARPPAFTKSKFVVLLHRLDFKAHGIEQKLYLDSISAVLSDIQTFTGEVIKEALSLMVDDEVLPVSLVRTALLASKAHTDVKKYLLNEFIPTLIRKKIWSTAPLHWEGIKHCVKTYAVGQVAQNIVEPTYRAILGLPGNQLKAILAAAPTVKPSLTNLLKVLSSEEKEEVISGRWIGISAEGQSATDTDKPKIIKELSG